MKRQALRRLMFATLATGFAWICTAPPQAVFAQPPLEVIAKRLQPREIADRLEALGTLRSNESVTLTALVTGVITGIHFEDGQLVDKGTLLVSMRSAEEEALLTEARVRVEEAKRQYERVQPLREGGAAPIALIDQRLREYETAKAHVSAIEARIEDRRIFAPFDGVLGLRNVSVGTLVTPGDEIVTLDDLSTMKLDFTVPSLYLPGVQNGLPVRALTRAFPGREFLGEVRSVATRIDPVTRSLMVRALLPNEEGLLRPGMLMTVEVLQNRRYALLIPEEAVLTEGRSRYAFVIAEGPDGKVLQRRELEPGSRQQGFLEVLAGIEDGELVVMHGTMQARDGQPARIIATHEEGMSLREMLRGKGEET